MINMKKNTSFDRAVAVSVIALAVVVIANALTLAPRDSTEFVDITLTVRLDGHSLVRQDSLHIGDTLVSEGRFAFILTDRSESEIRITANGRVTDGGYMHKDGRLYAKNQPIELEHGNKILAGRVVGIESTQSALNPPKAVWTPQQRPTESTRKRCMEFMPSLVR